MIGRSNPRALMYHGFCKQPPEHDPFSLFVTEQRLASQLKYLLRAGWQPLNLEGYLRARRSNRPSFLITIDDGFTSVGEIAAPMLRDAGVPAILFVPPALIGGTSSWMTEMPDAPIMTADQLSTMSEYGIELGVHGLDHTDLIALDDTELRRHVIDARELLADLTGVRARAFAYPRGVFDTRTIEAVRRAGYEAAFTVFSGEGRYAIPRIDVNGADTSVTFRLKLVPGYRRLWHAAGRFPAARRLARRTVVMRSGSEHQLDAPPRSTP